MNFEKGEVVVLRSGGDPMTISVIGKRAFGRQTFRCVWMVKGKKHDGAFDVELLEKRSEGMDRHSGCLPDTCQQRTGKHEEDGCWPAFE
jgi:uncharacterized protein YodC (DUF2158 family)